MEKPNLSGNSLKSFLSSVLLPVPDGPIGEEQRRVRFFSRRTFSRAAKKHSRFKRRGHVPQMMTGRIRAATLISGVG